jgi:hypothetical protein
MSIYYTRGTSGFNVAILSADEHHESILIERCTQKGHKPETSPIYWGSNEMGTLTDAERDVVNTLIPKAVRGSGSASPAPNSDASSPSSAQIIGYVVLGSVLTMAAQFVLNLL